MSNDIKQAYAILFLALTLGPLVGGAVGFISGTIYDFFLGRFISPEYVPYGYYFSLGGVVAYFFFVFTSAVKGILENNKTEENPK